jgi:CelD/BcsL family acetyltransferase involved in cellulose biosynthesis
VRDRSGEPASADEFLRLERLGWKGRAGTAMACRDGDAEYLRAVLAGAVGGAPPEVLALEAGGTAVAMVINFNVNGASFVFKAAYDPAFAKYSPGVHLELHHLGRIHAGAYEFSDSCSDPSDAFVNDLWPHRRAIVDIVAPVVPVAGAAVARAVEVAEAVRRPVRAARASRRKDPRAADDD